MPIVFVHGANVRDDDPEYERSVEVRDAHFATWLGPIIARTASLRVFNPNWGRYGAKFAWGLRSLPSGRYEQFGAEQLHLRAVLDEIAPGATSGAPDLVLRIARQSLVDAVDLLWASAAYAGGPIAAAKLADTGKAANDYAHRDPTPEWLSTIQNDDQLVDALLEAICVEPTRIELFGARDFRNTFIRGCRAAMHAVASVPIAMVRSAQHARFSRFIGDVVLYFDDRGRRGSESPIVKEVATSFREAARERRTDEMLVIIAHSMGGNIAYDVLTSFATDIQCDIFVTVGSQVALFEEMKVFCASDPAIPDQQRARVELPANVQNWINVFDPIDILSYAASAVFGDVKDASFVASSSPLGAHENYFARPEFFRHLAERLSA